MLLLVVEEEDEGVPATFLVGVMEVVAVDDDEDDTVVELEAIQIV